MKGKGVGEVQIGRKEPEQEGARVCVSKARVRRKTKEGEGRRAADSGSEGSRDERKSREEGCGGFVFIGHGHTE